MTERTLIIKHETVEDFVEGFGEQVESDGETPEVVSFADPDEL